MSGFLDRLGRRAVRHRWWFISVWIVAAVAIVRRSRSPSTASPTTTSGSPSAQSQEALDLLEQDFPSQAGDNATVVFETPARYRRARRSQPAISASVAALGKIPHVTSVSNPYGPHRERVHLEERRHRARHRAVRHARRRTCSKRRLRPDQAATAPATQAGITVAYGGAVVDYADQPPSGNADLIGLLAAVVILLFAFGSVVAMGLPILTALFGLGVGISLDRTSSRRSPTIGTVAPTLATMIGLGVGIDYSLFIVTRYRENLADGLTIEAAVGRSVATAGSAVLFAGRTVVIAICGLAVSGIPYVARLGYMAGARRRGDDARRDSPCCPRSSAPSGTTSTAGGSRA